MRKFILQFIKSLAPAIIFFSVWFYNIKNFIQHAWFTLKIFCQPIKKFLKQILLIIKMYFQPIKKFVLQIWRQLKIYLQHAKIFLLQSLMQLKILIYQAETFVLQKLLRLHPNAVARIVSMTPTLNLLTTAFFASASFLMTVIMYGAVHRIHEYCYLFLMTMISLYIVVLPVSIFGLIFSLTYVGIFCYCAYAFYIWGQFVGYSIFALLFEFITGRPVVRDFYDEEELRFALAFLFCVLILIIITSFLVWIVITFIIKWLDPFNFY